MWELVRLSARPVRVLVRPSNEDLALPVDPAPPEEDSPGGGCFNQGDEDFKDQLCKELSRWLGWGPCAFSSWDDTCRRIATGADSLAQHLNATMFASAQSPCRVVSIETSCLHGEYGPDIADVSWWKRFLTSYVESNYDYNGRATSTTTANADPALAQNLGRPPTLSTFLLSAPSGEKVMTVQGEIERLTAEAAQRGDVYLVLLDQRYNCQQHNPPQGRLRWRSCSVLIWMEMGLKPFLLVQLSVASSSGGVLEISGTNLAGDEISRWTGRPDEETFKSVRDGIARVTGQLASSITMILPSGQLVDEAMLSKRLDEVLKDEV